MNRKSIKRVLVTIGITTGIIAVNAGSCRRRDEPQRTDPAIRMKTFHATITAAVIAAVERRWGRYQHRLAVGFASLGRPHDALRHAEKATAHLDRASTRTPGWAELSTRWPIAINSSDNSTQRGPRTAPRRRRSRRRCTDQHRIRDRAHQTGRPAPCSGRLRQGGAGSLPSGREGCREQRHRSMECPHAPRRSTLSASSTRTPVATTPAGAAVRRGSRSGQHGDGPGAPLRRSAVAQSRRPCPRARRLRHAGGAFGRASSRAPRTTTRTRPSPGRPRPRRARRNVAGPGSSGRGRSPVRAGSDNLPRQAPSRPVRGRCQPQQPRRLLGRTSRPGQGRATPPARPRHQSLDPRTRPSRDRSPVEQPRDRCRSTGSHRRGQRPLSPGAVDHRACPSPDHPLTVICRTNAADLRTRAATSAREVCASAG